MITDSPETQLDRGITPLELNDPDFTWLVNSYRETHPHYNLVSRSGSAVVLIEITEDQTGKPPLLLPHKLPS